MRTKYNRKSTKKAFSKSTQTPHQRKKKHLSQDEYKTRRVHQSILDDAEKNVSHQEELTRFSHSIPLDFPENVVDEVKHFSEYSLNTISCVGSSKDFCTTGTRIDLRKLPFVTIDGEDARDFDDAIFVEQKESTFILWVAIADVSLYVRPSTAIDKEAFSRGNSYYFPTSVTPMLPEVLCNGLCSLQPNEDRAVMAVRMLCDSQGAGGFVCS